MPKGTASKRVWDSLTPEARAERVARMLEARARNQREKQPNPETPPLEPVAEPSERVSRAFVRLLQVGCTRWVQWGLSPRVIDTIVVVLVSETVQVHDLLLALSDQVARHEQNGRTLAVLVDVVDHVAAHHEVDVHELADALALLIGLSPTIGIVLEPVPPTTSWVQ